MRRKHLAASQLVLLMLLGCATHRDRNPHNDVLIFGTSTKLALDVAAPVQSAGVPEFTVGYKRLEAVWMPLRTSGNVIGDSKTEYNACVKDLTEKDKQSQKDAQSSCTRFHGEPIKYVSKASGIDSRKGGATDELDTYSVFASLGAKGSLSFNGAGGNLAQFFATGIAAQRLGANPAVSSALNAIGPEAEVEKAKAEQAKVELTATEILAKEYSLHGLPPDGLDGSAAAMSEKRKKEMQETADAARCVERWRTSAPTELDDRLKQLLESERSEVVEELRIDDELRKIALESCFK